ncbi:PTS sugar transporter subunit IIA [Acidovorax sp. MR-S7]|uniref:PTS sugar transporter subunit IIA n=1 Tax=Acidovorax sp. MR-S7 TaxID=1268622 RepID=UPI00037E882E|nr:PTS sugar transporter subunit IIA [Acidovorax sp. MR-S7]GAD22081.1 phosphotransferase system mannitol/fructose-specific IIA domain [Acidovorax sp. MR-S7]
MGALSGYLEARDILLGVQATGKRELFEMIGKHMEVAHDVPADSVASSLQRRELAGSTALGRGVAIPHARVKELDRIRLVYARLAPALSFDTPDGMAVSDVVALMVPAPATQDHLDVLAHVASLFSDQDFRKALHACQDPIQVKEVFERWPC